MSKSELPLQNISFETWQDKYQVKDEKQNPVDLTIDDMYKRVAWKLTEHEPNRNFWYEQFLQVLRDGATGAGRIMSNAGAEEHKPAVSLINCTVSQTVKDSMYSILESNLKAGLTLKAGCGIGYEWSTLRPKNAFVSGAGAFTSGPLSFMDIFDATTFTVSSAGGRRGAQMGTMAVWHPDIIDFITAKRTNGKLRKFNLSLLIDDDFMYAVKNDLDWQLVFPLSKKEQDTFNHNNVVYKSIYWKKSYCDEMGYILNDKEEILCKVYNTLKARELWDIIMKSTYDFAEPGFLLISKINKYNNNYFCEVITATNPCFTGNTMIAVADGRNAVSIKELAEQSNGKEKFKVFSAREGLRNNKFSHWKAEIKEAIAFKTGTKEVIKVILSDNSSFKCTPEHLLATKDGRWIEAQFAEGEELGKFYTFSNKNNNKSYRTINSKTNGYSKQCRMLWEYENGEKPKGFHIDHKDSNSKNDFLNNLELLSEEEHKSKTIETRNGINPIQKIVNTERFEWLQRVKNIKANSSKYNWSEDKLNKILEEFIKENPEPIKEDKNVYMNEKVYVISVEWNGEIEDVYDLTVDDNHNFYIITDTDDDKYMNCSGVLVHNCGEQPLPENGACLLGSINLAMFIINPFTPKAKFDYEKYIKTIHIFSRFLDNVVEFNGLPLEEQRYEIEYKRRHGMGYLGLGSALSLLGMEYGSEESVKFTEEITKILAIEGYAAGIDLAIEKGCAPIFNDDFTYKGVTKNAKEWWVAGEYMKQIFEARPDLLEKALKYGSRYTHAVSIAPTGTIAFSINNNVSNGIEPTFSHKYTRNIIKAGKNSKVAEVVYSYEMLLYKHLTGNDEVPSTFSTSDSITPKAHIDIQAAAQKWVDSSISKTINVPTDTNFEDFKDIYMYAYDMGLKGCTTFRWNPETLQGVLVRDSDLENTYYNFELEDGSIIVVRADDQLDYEGEIVQAQNLYDAIKEGYYKNL